MLRPTGHRGQSRQQGVCGNGYVCTQGKTARRAARSATHTVRAALPRTLGQESPASIHRGAHGPRENGPEPETQERRGTAERHPSGVLPTESRPKRAGRDSGRLGRMCLQAPLVGRVWGGHFQAKGPHAGPDPGFVYCLAMHTAGGGCPLITPAKKTIFRPASDMLGCGAQRGIHDT